MEGWLACLTELGVPEDNPTWAKAAPGPEFLVPPTSYSPIVLPSFNEEEYINRSEEEEEATDDVVSLSNKVAQLADEARQTAIEGTGEDAILDLPPKP